MADRLEVRDAAEADLAGLLALYAQLHPEDRAVPESEAMATLQRIALYEGSAVVVGLVDDVVVSTCCLIVIPNLTRSGASYALIENVVTDPRHRRVGHGSAVLSCAIDKAWRNGCYKVMLLTGSVDASVHRFYKGAGFEQSKTGFQIRRSTASSVQLNPFLLHGRV